MSEIEPYTLTEKHNHLKYAQISSSVSNEKTGKELKHSNTVHRYSYNRDENDHGGSTNMSSETGASRFKNIHNSTPHSIGGPVRLPYLTSSGSPSKNDLASHSYQKDSTNYAIGVGKTTSSNNLKATVSGGTFSLSGQNASDRRDRIEFKCSPSGKISQLSPAKKQSEPTFNHYYHKFRQQTKSVTSTNSKIPSSKSQPKNKFPLPFTGIEYPMIDGGGITS
jgi:hypothetical protein